MSRGAHSTRVAAAALPFALAQRLHFAAAGRSVSCKPQRRDRLASALGGGMFEQIEEQVRGYVDWLRLLVEALGALVIAAGVAVVIVALARHVLARREATFTAIRLSFARYLTLALELQLAADILSTSIAPSWDRIGKLAAIAIIRTGLNFFLSREMTDERSSDEPAIDPHPPLPSAPPQA
jgi:uncharacterized membrane protein